MSQYQKYKPKIPGPKTYGQQWDEYTIHYRHTLMSKIINKPDLCPVCKKDKKLHLTNLNHEYKEDQEEWMYKCVKCHSIYDHSFLIERK